MKSCPLALFWNVLSQQVEEFHHFCLFYPYILFYLNFDFSFWWWSNCVFKFSIVYSIEKSFVLCCSLVQSFEGIGEDIFFVSITTGSGSYLLNSFLFFVLFPFGSSSLFPPQVFRLKMCGHMKFRLSLWIFIWRRWRLCSILFKKVHLLHVYLLCLEM